MTRARATRVALGASGQGAAFLAPLLRAGPPPAARREVLSSRRARGPQPVSTFIYVPPPQTVSEVRDTSGSSSPPKTQGPAQTRGVAVKLSGQRPAPSGEDGGEGRMTRKFTYANINRECSTTQMKPRRPGWGAPSPTEGAWPQPGASLWRLCSPGETPLCSSLEGCPAALPPAGARAPPAAGQGGPGRRAAVPLVALTPVEAGQRSPALSSLSRGQRPVPAEGAMQLLPEAPGTRPREAGCGWLECDLAKTLLWFVPTPEPRPACPVAP